MGLISKKSGGLWNMDLEMFQKLLVMDTLRGEDSTGAFSVMRNNELQSVKVGSNPFNLYATKEWIDFRQASLNRGHMLIGHNRSATRGSVNSNNAHPFHEQHIVLVHNGTLRGDHKKLGDREVDSHALCSAFAEKGAEEVLPTIDGAMALVWYDLKKERLFAIRNYERPLTITETDDMIILASEAWMPVALLEKESKKIISSCNLPVETLFEFEKGGKYTTKKLMLREEEYPITKWSYQPPTQIGHTTNMRDISKIKEDIPLDRPHLPTQPSSNIIIPFIHPDYRKSDLIAVKLSSAALHANGRFRVLGHSDMPGREMVDIVGYLPEGVAHTGLAAWMEGNPVAEILSMNKTTCGPSLWLGNFVLDLPIPLHNNREISSTAWAAVVDDCMCTQCGMHIGMSENLVTSVSRTADGMKIVCADCIENKLTGAIKDAFKQRRANSLQTSVPIVESIGEQFIPLANAPSSQSLQ